MQLKTEQDLRLKVVLFAKCKTALKFFECMACCSIPATVRIPDYNQLSRIQDEFLYVISIS